MASDLKRGIAQKERKCELINAFSDIAPNLFLVHFLSRSSYLTISNTANAYPQKAFAVVRTLNLGSHFGSRSGETSFQSPHVRRIDARVIYEGGNINLFIGTRKLLYE